MICNIKHIKNINKHTCNNGGTPCLEFDKELRFEWRTVESKGSNFTVKLPPCWSFKLCCKSFVLDLSSG